MSKSILVIDMPECCVDCEFVDCDANGWVCGRTNKEIYRNEANDKRPDWCPLKAVPKKRDLKDIENHVGLGTDYIWSEGYNACIDEILGGNGDE